MLRKENNYLVMANFLKALFIARDYIRADKMSKQLEFVREKTLSELIEFKICLIEHWMNLKRKIVAEPVMMETKMLMDQNQRIIFIDRFCILWYRLANTMAGTKYSKLGISMLEDLKFRLRLIKDHKMAKKLEEVINRKLALHTQSSQ